MLYGSAPRMQCSTEGLREIEAMVGEETEGEEYLLLHISCGDGHDEGWIE